jgi:hypothetical protein
MNPRLKHHSLIRFPAVILSFAEFAELLAAVHEKADERIHGIAEAML